MPEVTGLGKGGRWTAITVWALVAGAAIAYFERDRLGWHVKGLIFAAYGAAFLLPLRSAVLVRARLRGGARAQGTIVGAERSVGRSSVYYHAAVRFTTQEGRAVVFKSTVGYENEPEIGRPVPVRYRPEAPEQAEVDNAIAWILPAAVSALFALILLTAGVATYVHA